MTHKMTGVQTSAVELVYTLHFFSFLGKSVNGNYKVCFHDCCKWKHSNCISALFLINIQWWLACWLRIGDLIKQTGLTSSNRPKCHVYMPIGLLAGKLLLLYFVRHSVKVNNKELVIQQEINFHWKCWLKFQFFPQI